MTDRDKVHDELARALDSVLAAASTPIGRITPNQLADAAMVIVGPIVAERDTYRANGKEAAAIAFDVSEKLGAIEAELAETKAAHRAALLGLTPPGKPTYEALEEHVAGLVQENGVLRGDLDEAQREAKRLDRGWAGANLTASNLRAERDEAQESRLQWAAEARTDYVRWLHAEQAWSLQLAEEERLRLVAELEKATTALTDVMAERGEAARSARDSAVYAEQGWTETERLRARVAELEGQLSPKPHNCDRYVDVHHLVEAEIQIARHLRGAPCQPGAHSTTQIAKAVAWAFDMDLTPEAEAASQPTPSDLQVPPSLGATTTNDVAVVRKEIDEAYGTEVRDVQ